MNFDANDFPYTSRRAVTYAKNGVAAAGNPTAASVGLQVLLEGGNAIDAAIAMSFVQPLVEPSGNGLGSDAFALIWYEGKLYGINGSGPSPEALTLSLLKDRGLDAIPTYGPLSVDVPGAVGAWIEIQKRFGKMALEDVTRPAISYAREGFPVSPNVARLWEDAARKFAAMTPSETYRPWFDLFCPEGRPLRPGEIYRSEAMADTIEAIAETEGKSFYEGETAKAIEAFMGSVGGVLTRDDLASYRPEWVEPISVNYKGYDVWEIPPNGHGISVLMALQILKRFEMAGHDDAKTLHRQIEAMKLAMTDAARHVTEPSAMRARVADMLSESYAAKRASLIGETAIDPVPGDPTGPSTVYFCTADRFGNMVSMIQSNYHGFGSGIVVPDTGVSLNNRAANFVTDPEHVNVLAGGKRPYHTIIPGFLTKDGHPVGPFGIMGGFMQPQAHVQVVQNMIDFHMSPQQALDAPRWQWVGGKKVQMEQDFDNAVIRRLQKMGHTIEVIADTVLMGRGQVIVRQSDGTYCAGTEKRTDGQIMCY
ncbi:MAG TPA: gamma-glutamyltransferase [Sutterella sp.]|nr:gamma-glutamyltransferase [Sutterella sp.]